MSAGLCLVEKPVEFTVGLPQARSVAVSGSFNDWDASCTPLSPDSVHCQTSTTPCIPPFPTDPPYLAVPGRLFTRATLSACAPVKGNLLSVPRESLNSVVARLKRQVVEISDQERGRIGRDLHDSVCQLLVNLSFDLRVLCKDLEARHLPESARAERIEQRLHETMRLARRFTHGLCPVNLLGNELGAALQTLACVTTQDFGVSCTAECNPRAAETSSVVATHVYRIAQEAVHNAVKHAEPRRIHIRLTADEDRLRLEVINDGRALPYSLPAGAGMGLQIMQYRARLLDGHFEMRRFSGGTIVACTVPRRKRKLAGDISAPPPTIDPGPPLSAPTRCQRSRAASGRKPGSAGTTETALNL